MKNQKRLKVSKEVVRNLTVAQLERARGGADSGSFTETGSGLCVTAAQYSCVSVAAGCA